MSGAVAASVRSAVRSRTLSQGSTQAEKRAIHASQPRQAIVMPYLSPLMKEGTISVWKKKEGDAFRPGDVLLSIESDYYNVDIEADHPGVLGKILRPAGSAGVKVEEVIALVASDPIGFAPLKDGGPCKNETLSSLPRTPTRSKTILQPTIQQTPPRRTPAELISPRPRSPTSNMSTSAPPRRSFVKLPATSAKPNLTAQHTSSRHESRSAASTPPPDSTDGTAIRRMIRDKFAQAAHQQTSSMSDAPSIRPTSTGKENTTKSYFDGIL